MRVQKRSPWLNSLGVVLAAMALWGTQANAAVSSDKPGSVVIWPKVIADGTRDTLISLTNTRNEQAYAHCEYVQALGICAVTGSFCSVPNASPGSPGACEPIAGNVCTQQWQEADFDIVLTRQQPTIWRVSTGRVDNPFLPADGACDLILPANPTDALRESCPGLFLIGQVPPAPDQPFRGQLTCIQVAMDGGAIGSNALKGEATIETLDSTQISTYNSINVEALPEGPVGGVEGLIRLDGVEYSACPTGVEVSHYAPGAQDLVAADLDPAACDPMAGCPVQTEITLVPCRNDFNSLTGTRFSTQVRSVNEFEQPLSNDTVFQCWANFDLRDIGIAPASASGTTFQRTRFIPNGTVCIQGNLNFGGCQSDADCGPGGVCGPVSGALAIVEEFHNTAASLADPTTDPAGTAASNGYSVAFNGSLERSGVCRNDVGTKCTSNAQCPNGLCRFSGAQCTGDAQCGVDDFCDRCINDEIMFTVAPIAVPTPVQ